MQVLAFHGPVPRSPLGDCDMTHASGVSFDRPPSPLFAANRRDNETQKEGGVPNLHMLSLVALLTGLSLTIQLNQFFVFGPVCRCNRVVSFAR